MFFSLRTVATAAFALLVAPSFAAVTPAQIQIIAGFQDIVSTANSDISNMQGTPAVTTDADSQAIFDAFREFVRVHQALLSILIGKAGLFSDVPLIGAPVAAVLRSVEGVVDTIAFGLIDMVQSESADIASQQASLDQSLTQAITAYLGLQIKAKRTFVA
ncbi:UVI-1 protein [Glonium stellatum]|uniref:UVI-1 protein n=1 Tax=Glonium stellatum TaxID=574774 RepID=A0A8E2EXB1_9PEZI|nr:UVI-1 protein [Glonium stellatum]